MSEAPLRPAPLRPSPAPAAGVPSRRPALPAWPNRNDLRLRAGEALRALGDAARRDIEEGLAFPLVAAVFACGIAFYFVLPREPWWPASLALASALVGATIWRRRIGHAARGWVICAALACGVAVGATATARVAAPRLDHERTVAVEGRVVDVDATAKGGTRLGVSVIRMEGKGLTPETTPTMIAATLTLKGGFVPTVGDGVRFKARLKPPEGPVLPGGYDFARRAWFEGRGASGYLLGRAEPLDLGPPDLTTRLLAPIGVLRHAIAERVRATLPGATGAIGAALMVGEQRAIPESANEPLRASGLTHIVSISGLHLSLVAGGVITIMRLVFVLFPGFALRRPVKKWAAAAAIVVATIYLLLSGNQVAALRSHLMLTIALIAVMVDRPAISMHTIAVSAVLVLLFDPSNVLEPSFLMSYLAVIALVASYDLWRLHQARRPPPTKESGPIAHGLGSALRHVEGLAFSSLIAGLATAPVIAGIFYRGAPYSILANMIVLPVTGLVVMPAAVVSALLMPFGLDALPLWVMGLGIDFMVAVGRWVAGFPGGAGMLGLPHPAMMPLGVASVLWLSLWRSRIRLFGVVPGLAALALMMLGPHPDVFVGRHATPVAVRGFDGRLDILAGPQERFDTAIWLAADADPRAPDPRALGRGWQCDELGCSHRLPGVSPDPDDDVVIAVVRDPRGFEEDCRRAAVVISALAAPPGCAERTTVIDRLALARTGATTLDFLGEPTPASQPRHGDLTQERKSGSSPASIPARRSRAPVDPTDDSENALTSHLATEDPHSDPLTRDPLTPIDEPVAAHPVDAPAVTTAELEPLSIEADEDPADDEPTWPRQKTAQTASLPRWPRPWTPRDLLAERRVAEQAGVPAAESPAMADRKAAAPPPSRPPEPSAAR